MPDHRKLKVVAKLVNPAKVKKKKLKKNKLKKKKLKKVEVEVEVNLKKNITK